MMHGVEAESYGQEAAGAVDMGGWARGCGHEAVQVRVLGHQG